MLAAGKRKQTRFKILNDYKTKIVFNVKKFNANASMHFLKC